MSTLTRNQVQFWVAINLNMYKISYWRRCVGCRNAGSTHITNVRTMYIFAGQYRDNCTLGKHISSLLMLLRTKLPSIIALIIVITISVALFIYKNKNCSHFKMADHILYMHRQYKISHSHTLAHPPVIRISIAPTYTYAPPYCGSVRMTTKIRTHSTRKFPSSSFLLLPSIIFHWRNKFYDIKKM